MVSAMPSAEHEAIAHLVRRDPVHFLTLLAAWVGVQVPSRGVTRMVDSNLSDRTPTESHADTVFVLEGADGRAQFAVIVEIQRQPDSDKVYAWLLYLAMARRLHECPAMVVVIATSRRTATFAATAIETGHPGCTFTPVVCGPDQVPPIGEPAKAACEPIRAAFAAIIHQDETAQLRTFAETLSYLEADQSQFYAEFVLQALIKDNRQILEDIMATERYDYWDKVHQGGRQEGHQEGRQEGWQEAVLTMLAHRDLAVPAAVLERIQRCQDPTQLRTWLERAAVADNVEDVVT